MDIHSSSTIFTSPNWITIDSGKERSTTFLLSIIFGCVGSLLSCKSPLQLRRAGTTLHRGARASHRRGLSHCGGAQAPDAQAQQLWPTGPAAPWHAGSSQTGARTRVPRIGRRTPNPCTTREAQYHLFEQRFCGNSYNLSTRWKFNCLNKMENNQKQAETGGESVWKRGMALHEFPMCITFITPICRPS